MPSALGLVGYSIGMNGKGRRDGQYTLVRCCTSQNTRVSVSSEGKGPKHQSPNSLSQGMIAPLLGPQRNLLSRKFSAEELTEVLLMRSNMDSCGN